MRFSISIEIARSAKPVLPNPKIAQDGYVKPRPAAVYPVGTTEVPGGKVVVSPTTTVNDTPKERGPIERRAMSLVATPLKKAKKIRVRNG